MRLAQGRFSCDSSGATGQDQSTGNYIEMNSSLSGRSMFLGAALLGPGRGGIARLARLTAKALLSSGADLEMLSLLDEQSFDLAGRTVRVAGGSKLGFAARANLEALSRSHFVYDSASCAPAHLRLGRFHRPYALWMCGIEVWGGLKPAMSRAIRAADLRLVISDFTLNKYRQMHGDRSDCKVCWLGTEDDEPPVAAPEFSGPPTVMIMARIDDTQGYKGHAELVAAWPKIASAVPDARLLIVGGGSGLAALQNEVRVSPVAGQIEIAGFVSESEAPAYWHRAHVFAMPSRNEGFGLVYVEAMRYGLPVVASVHDAAPEVNLHGETGYNVDLDKKDDLADRLIELLRSPDLGRKLGEAGFQRWREHFRFSAFQRRLIPILEEFVGNG